jgi:uncharacterized membrane protein
VSDITHFNRSSPTPWLDLGAFVAFAWAGLLLGVVSMRLVHRTIERTLGKLVGWTVVAGAAAASGFGVALGRFGRLNSWEIVTSPESVASTSLWLVTNGRLLAVAVFFAALLLAVYTGGPSLGGSTSGSTLLGPARRDP